MGSISLKTKVFLAVQVILIFTGPIRKRSSSAFFRFVIWSCYLLADWVADLALGLLLNNMGNIGGGGGSVGSLLVPSRAGPKHVPHGDTATSGGVGGGGGCSGSSSPIIFAFWAPFLLLHLGGPDTITAYSLEDNELWRRHLIGFLFELTAASVVFFCSLGDNPMIVATPFMFIAGIIKYVERTYSLYYGSTDGFPIAILGTPEVQSTNIPKLMQAYSSRRRAGLIVELYTLTESSNILRDLNDVQDEVIAYELFVNFRAIFVNGVVSTRNLRTSEEFYLALRPDGRKAFHIVELELCYMYDMLYTKMPVLSTTVGYVMRFVGCCCLISSFIIFRGHDKSSMLPIDIGITYTLLAVAVALEAAALAMLISSNWTFVYIHRSRHFKWLSWLVGAIRKTEKYLRMEQQATWSGIVLQMNLVDHALRTCERDDHHGFFLRTVAKVVNRVRSKPILNIIKRDGEDYQRLLEFIFVRIQKIVTRSPKSEERKEVCKARGERAILESGKYFSMDNIKSTVIFKSVTKRDFDETLLMWHIATDLCFQDDEMMPDEMMSCHKRVSRCLSQYLLYLLIKKPEMVSTTKGIGQLRYNTTYEGAKLLFRSIQGSTDVNHKAACTMVQDIDPTGFEDHFIKGDRTKTVLSNACVLARALRKFNDQKVMWKVVAHVWMEMLTFTAAHTQPKEHLKELSKGGELLTAVWLLMAHMGLTSSMFEVQETESIHKLIVYDK